MYILAERVFEVIGKVFFVVFFIISITFTAGSDLLAAPLAFNSNENCSDVKGEMEAAKDAVIASCKWIKDIGKGKRENIDSAFGKIFKHRFCKDNYVYIIEYLADLRLDNHKDDKIMLLHPVKPGLEKSLTPHFIFNGGYRILSQQMVAAKMHPEGCWIKYLWTKPGTEKLTDKITYTMKCKDKETGKEFLAAGGVYASHKLATDENAKAKTAECNGISRSPYEN